MFTNPVPMAQAVMACRGYGALLLTVETSIEQQFIKNFVQNNTVPGLLTSFLHATTANVLMEDISSTFEIYCVQICI